MNHDQYRASLISRILEIARAVVAGTGEIIGSARELAHLLRDIGLENEDKNLVQLFVAIDSETDHLPVGPERTNWNPDSLKARDSEIAEYQVAFREDVLAACKKLIERYAPAES